MNVFSPNVHLGSHSFATWLFFGFGLLLLMKIVFSLWMIRRGWDPLRTVVVLVMFVLAGAISAILLPSILGPIVFGTLAATVVVSVLGLHRRVGFPFSVILVSAIAVGRVGCLLNGCCFGEPTSLPWGVCYPLGSAAHWFHLAEGWIRPDALSSLPVHPTPLYESGMMLLLLPALFLLKKRLRSEGALAMITIGLLLLARIVVEFFRAMTNVWWSVIQVGPLSLLQLALLGGAILFFLAAWWLEHRPAVETAPGSESLPLPPARFRLSLILLAFASGMALLLKDALHPTLLVQLMILIPVGAVTLLFVPGEQVGFRFAPRFSSSLGMLLLLTPLLLGSKPRIDLTHAHRSWLYSPVPGTGKLVRLGDERTSSAAFRFRWNSIAKHTAAHPLSISSAEQVQEHLGNPGLHYYAGLDRTYERYSQTGCGGDVTTTVADESGAFFGIERWWPNMDGSYFAMGLRASYFRYKAHRTTAYYDDPNHHETKTYEGPELAGYMRAEGDWVGFEIGGIALEESATHLTDSNLLSFSGDYAMILGVRIGPPVFNVFGAINDPELSGPYPNSFHLGFGIGGSSPSSPGLRLGRTLLIRNSAFFATLNINMPGGWRIQPEVRFYDSHSLGAMVRLAY